MATIIYTLKNGKTESFRLYTARQVEEEIQQAELEKSRKGTLVQSYKIVWDE